LLPKKELQALEHEISDQGPILKLMDRYAAPSNMSLNTRADIAFAPLTEAAVLGIGFTKDMLVA